MAKMNTLYIRDFGPLKEVSVEFNKITFFVGPQGAGKSTIAKLYSMFTWLEKKLIRGMVEIKQIEKSAYFKQNLCGYHRLTSYFKSSSEILFEGQHYNFHYKDNKFKIFKRPEEYNIEVYKVMYIPSERNALCALDNLAGLKSIPESLLTFKDEYDLAQKELSGIKLPINNVKFKFNKQYNRSYLEGEGYKINISDASSGFQAAVPMLLVSKYLTELVETNVRRNNGSGLSVEESDRLKKEVNLIMNDSSLSTTVKKQALSSISKRFGYSGFVNIVEEPEQNLYPSSQRVALYELLCLSKVIEGNKLIITTHSPYLIDYVTLAIKAAEIIEKGLAPDLVSPIVPVESVIAATDVNIYQLSEGGISLLAMKDGIPSDSNDLNFALEETNSQFDALLDLEDSLDEIRN